MIDTVDPYYRADVGLDKPPPKVLFLMPDVSLPPRIYKAIKTLTNSEYPVKVVGWDRGEKRSLFHLPERAESAPIKLKAPYGSLWLAFYLILFYIKTIGRIWNDDCEIIHCCRFDVLIPGAIIAKLRRKQLIYDAFEIYPLMVGDHFKGGVRKVMIGCVTFVENTFARAADLILTVDTADDILKNRFLKINDNVVVIKNVPEISDDINDDIVSRQRFDEPMIFYAGGLMKRKGIYEMIRCLRYVKDQIPSVKFIVAGNFNSAAVETEINTLVSELHLSDAIEFLGHIPYEQARQYAHRANIGLELYHHHPVLSISKGSSKLFMYMEAGLPIIASDLPGIGSLVRETGFGVVVDPYDVKLIADSVLSILQDEKRAKELSIKGSNAFRNKYNWNLEQEKFLYHYRCL